MGSIRSRNETIPNTYDSLVKRNNIQYTKPELYKVTHIYSKYQYKQNEKHEKTSSANLAFKGLCAATEGFVAPVCASDCDFVRALGTILGGEICKDPKL